MANIESLIVIINKNKIQKKKTAENSSKRALSSTSTNSPDHEDKKEIINCLNDVGHKVISITNITHSANKLPLPLFNISLARNTNNREIFKITKLLNTIIKFEYTKRQLGPPQCHHCQKYGHTRNYCYRKPRCVKCGAEHFTDNCTKQLEEPAKCANCGGNHTANYKEIINTLKLKLYHLHPTEADMIRYAQTQEKNPYMPKPQQIHHHPINSKSSQVSLTS
ncbi:Uncharacterized protein FWK35_00034534 [Aphis craccivora]|uniref:Pre-C2HC domain-containing protein n=1 Tax=Aphis craccivora TaxID=307492 RepID=A0A6G0YZT2_APHCR|nr:Uncharacterized protein FWK35_00034534 [Aphis craccivora]